MDYINSRLNDCCTYTQIKSTGLVNVSLESSLRCRKRTTWIFSVCVRSICTYILIQTKSGLCLRFWTRTDFPAYGLTKGIKKYKRLKRSDGVIWPKQWDVENSPRTLWAWNHTFAIRFVYSSCWLEKPNKSSGFCLIPARNSTIPNSNEILKGE